MSRTEKLETLLSKIEDAYRRAFADMIPSPRRYFAISVVLSVANVATGVKYGVATKVASLFF